MMRNFHKHRRQRLPLALPIGAFCLSTLLFAATQWRTIPRRSSTPALVNRLNHLLGQLAQFPVSHEVSALPYDVPGAVRPWLTTEKHMLLELIQADLKRQPSAHAGAILKAFRLQIAKATSGVPEPKCSVERACGYYGKPLTLYINRPKYHHNLFVLITGIDLLCGQDESLYLFRRQASGGWRLLLADAVNGYKPINRARENPKYAISPTMPGRNWFLIVAASPPWCTSLWSSLNLQVFEPNAAKTTLTLVESQNRGYYRGDDYRIEATRNGFALAYFTAQDLDSNLFVRIGLAVYRRQCSNGTQQHCSFVRLRYYSTGPRGFLSAWADRPWARVKTWNATPLPSLRQIHRQMKILATAKSPTQPSLDRFRKCRITNPGWQDWQVRLSYSGDTGPPIWARYFRIRQTGPGQFAIDGLNSRPFPECTAKVPHGSAPQIRRPLPDLMPILRAARR